MSILSSIIRPFADRSIEPTPFTKPGQKGTPPVVLHVGLRGGTKTFSFSASSSASYYSPKAHVESAPRSGALQQQMSKVADNVQSGGGSLASDMKGKLADDAGKAQKAQTDLAP